MDFKEKTTVLGLIGFGFYGAFCPVISAIVATSQASDGTLHVCNAAYLARIGDPLFAYILEVVISGLFGAVVLGGTAVYTLEHWSLLKCTATHFILSVTALFATAFTLGWMSVSDKKSCVIILTVSLVFYILVWLLNYLSYKIEIKKMNEELSHLKETEMEE